VHLLALICRTLWLTAPEHGISSFRLDQHAFAYLIVRVLADNRDVKVGAGHFFLRLGELLGVNIRYQAGAVIGWLRMAGLMACAI
jgi:hypothetical protein